MCDVALDGVPVAFQASLTPRLCAVMRCRVSTAHAHERLHMRMSAPPLPSGVDEACVRIVCTYVQLLHDVVMVLMSALAAIACAALTEQYSLTHVTVITGGQAVRRAAAREHEQRRRAHRRATHRGEHQLLVNTAALCSASS
jgi:hypothetical protein